MSASCNIGILFAAADEIGRRAASLAPVEPGELRLLAGHLDHVADRIRAVAACAEADTSARRVARLPSDRRAAA